MQKVESYVCGEWSYGVGGVTPLIHAVTGETIGEVADIKRPFEEVLDYGRRVGGAPLRAMTFYERAIRLKELAKYLLSRKDEFYSLSAATGATKLDSWIDIEGGIGTLFTYSGKGRRELPDHPFHVEGDQELISKHGTFTGQHICVPLEGVAIHINAYNFPCWGMLEKLAPTLLAGMPAIVKPATPTCYLTEAMVRAITDSQVFPAGSVQLVTGSARGILDTVTCQDVVTFTGSATTGRSLKHHPRVLEHSVRFNMEADSLNFSLLGDDVEPGTPEFDIFIKEVHTEMTVKAGQKCTAIRRILVPERYIDRVVDALGERLRSTVVGDPAIKGVTMGPLVSKDQVAEVQERLAEIACAGEIVIGGEDTFEVNGASREQGAFFQPTLVVAKSKDASQPHDVEAFGPVSTVIGYSDLDEAIALTKRGAGSLAGSVVTGDDRVARQVVLGTAAYHGRLVLLNRHCAKESTGHGSPLPHLVHGGPGRAGGGEEMGGIRAVLHYMQRTALQGDPSTLTTVMGRWLKGAKRIHDHVHPFRKRFEQLQIGECFSSHRRTVTEADIVQFGCVSGDHFYAHFDALAAKESIFEDRVAHGYFLVSAAAGLFVDPGPGPVLANYGLENLRFVEPVYIGDTIHVHLTVKEKTRKSPRPEEKPQGIVEWDVEIWKQGDTLVASYSILTLVACMDRGDEEVAHEQ